MKDIHEIKCSALALTLYTVFAAHMPILEDDLTVVTYADDTVILSYVAKSVHITFTLRKEKCLSFSRNIVIIIKSSGVKYYTPDYIYIASIITF